jgi:hypothetical protein
MMWRNQLGQCRADVAGETAARGPAHASADLLDDRHQR